MLARRRVTSYLGESMGSILVVRREVMHQRRELEELEEENRRIREEQAAIREKYEDLMDEAEREELEEWARSEEGTSKSGQRPLPCDRTALGRGTCFDTG
ncbi:unnamed protein product [Durusdinium trenchii]|uniref:Uncharacterized protein n=1 Tax=Durusdinium trenchii TaxID=1381693 RepID=A0ABP0STP0_9DINO